MKKLISNKTSCGFFLIAALLLMLPLHTMAQWTPVSGSGIYYNSGKVSIGTTDFTYDFNVNGTTNLTGTLYTNTLKFTSELSIGKSGSTSLLRGLYTDKNILVVNSSDNSTTLGNTGANFIVKGVTLFTSATSPGFSSISSANLANYNVLIDQGLITPEVGIAAPASWADYVFNNDYQLASLDSVETYINEKGHLPGIPSADEVKEKGFYSANDLAVKLLEKVEELTLYTIEQDKEIKRLLTELEKFKNEKK